MPLTSINLDRALAIPGWMDHDELLWLARQASLAPRILEIGSHQGRSTRALADHTSGRIVTVDLWKRDADYAAFSSNLSDHIEQGRVTALRSSHEHLLSALSDPSLSLSYDFIFIDGSHAEPHVRRDLVHACSVLAPDGLLAGHDFGVHAPGVVRAVLDLFPNARAVPYTRIWQCRPEYKHARTSASEAVAL